MQHGRPVKMTKQLAKIPVKKKFTGDNTTFVESKLKSLIYRLLIRNYETQFHR